MSSTRDLYERARIEKRPKCGTVTASFSFFAYPGHSGEFFVGRSGRGTAAERA